VAAAWSQRNIPDDPVRQSNLRGYITFAMRGPSTRTTQVFINLGDNVSLDTKDFAPFGKVSEGMDVVSGLYSGYGESPQQPLIQSQGNQYLKAQFPNLDYIKSTKIE
jgi:peptidyl-prolyl cis-trans isomerase A (cyclophilin A)